MLKGCGLNGAKRMLSVWIFLSQATADYIGYVAKDPVHGRGECKIIMYVHTIWYIRTKARQTWWQFILIR